MSSSLRPPLVNSGPGECGASSRFWVIPLGVLAAGALVLVLVRIGFLPDAGWGGSPPPYWSFFPVGVLLLGLVVIVLVRTRWGWGSRSWGPRWEPAWDAEEIVRMRYARGEITSEQMVSMIRDLYRTDPDRGGPRTA